MRLEITGRLLSRNFLINFIGQAGPLLFAVASIPFIIRGLGVERFGLLSIAWVLLEYFIVFDLGLGRATVKYVAEAMGKGDKDKISRVASTAVIAQFGLVILGTVALISITPVLTEHILNIPPALAIEGKAIFQLLALSIPLVLVSGSVTGILAAAQRFDLVNAVNATFNSASPVLTLIGVLWFDWDLIEIVTMLVASRSIALVAHCWLCIRVFPSLKVPRFHLA
ncbi:MAG TPA: MATE family efflux transporter, partial [Pyrinomonadaceae bacterium]|nr:MATE family efflux transporter [Pyrinomonadaceae bacterium]